MPKEKHAETELSNRFGALQDDREAAESSAGKGERERDEEKEKEKETQEKDSDKEKESLQVGGAPPQSRLPPFMPSTYAPSEYDRKQRKKK